MIRKIFALLDVIADGLFSGKCNSCHYWKCCPAQRELRPERPVGDTEASRNENIPFCPVFAWLEKIRKGP